MAAVEIRGLRKSYGPAMVALKGIDLAIGSGAFFTLLGPSGCGKTTLLRSIAGFLAADSGEIHIGGRRIDAVPAHKRDIGMVFQDYAIFPHLSVADNVAFGLRNRRVSAEATRQRVAEALATVRLSGFEHRMPQELSGGQQQRVGLARAMVIRPQLLLMDEPLSNLDAKLRIELREDIRDIQKSLGITTIYVTHDQEEALVISDRICVMNAGAVEQVGTPWEVYKRPSRRFPAAFVGSINFFQASVEDGQLAMLGGSFPLPDATRLPPRVEGAIRPEDLVIAEGGAAPAGVRMEARMEKLAFLGREAQYTLAAPDGTRLLLNVGNPELHLLLDTSRSISVVLPWHRIAWFDPASGERIAGIEPP
jgi:ABC-type Fe3+/spermidine/putrescine transport system ATPase subunit